MLMMSSGSNSVWREICAVSPQCNHSDMHSAEGCNLYVLPVSLPLTELVRTSFNGLFGLVVKASTSREADPDSIPANPVEIFVGRVIPVT